eukprot:4821445-Prymnesium_polylepis.1
MTPVAVSHPPLTRALVQTLQSSNDSLAAQLKAEQQARAAVEAQNQKLAADATKAETAKKKATAAAAEAKKKATA